MSPTWDSTDAPDTFRMTPMGALRTLLRGVPLAVLVFGCLAILLLVRLIERPLFGLHRPVTPFITQFVCRNAFRLLGIGFSAKGALMTEQGAVVANHCSWLDIFALNARKRIYFVSKAEVAKWPGIGWLARATGTVFIERNPKRAREQTALF
ncbi:MAG: lysophospholipid acyltransferase family protein, partial [Arenibacterium sp.]